MKITWITRSFLDYRIPVYDALNQLCGGKLTLLYNGDVVPVRAQQKLFHVLGGNAKPLAGELKVQSKNSSYDSVANRGFRIPYQPGLVSAAMQTIPDIIVSDGFFQWTYAALWLRLTRHIPHVMCYEKTMHTERNAGRLRTLYRKCSSHLIDAICANGMLSGEYLRYLGYPEERITYGQMVADIENLQSVCDRVLEREVHKLKVQIGAQGQVFLYVGRIIPLKGITELLHAWKKANLMDATLVLVGDGSQRAELERMGVHNVVFVGSIDYDALTPYYAIADCFIIPTLEDNWSLVVPEAMACGLPIACSCYNGCYPELVKSENGWVFDPLNLDSTVHTLQQVAAKRSELKAMGNASRQIVSRYTPETAAQSIWEACQIAIKKH